MSRVFFVERPKPNIDIASAGRFGQITFIFDRHDQRVGIFECEAYSTAISECLRERKFDPENDYLCIAGKMVPVCMAVATAFKMFGSFRVLFYNPSTADYTERQFIIGDANGKSGQEDAKHSGETSCGSVQTSHADSSRDEDGVES